MNYCPTKRSTLIVSAVLAWFVSGVCSGEDFTLDRAQRLSQWLNNKAFSDELPLHALSWKVDSEKPVQRKLKHDLLTDLLNLAEIDQASREESISKFYEWVKYF